MWRINDAPNVDVCRLLNPKAYWATMSSPLHQHQDPVNSPLIHMICSAMMKNTQCLKMWLKRHPDKAITLHAYWQTPGCICNHLLIHQRTGGKLIQISMITTLIQGRLAGYFGYQISPTGGDNRRKRTQITPISLMWWESYSLPYHIGSEWRPAFPLGEMISAWGSQKPLVRPLAKESL